MIRRADGYDVVESDDAIGERSWGAPRVTCKASLLHDLEPSVVLRRGYLTIYYGDRVGDLIHTHLSREEVHDLAHALGRRVVRELHDSAMDLANQRRAYADERKRRLANKT